MYSILLVVPYSNLPHSLEEIQAIVSAKFLKSTSLFGEVTTKSLMEKLENKYDIFWFIGHSDSEGYIHLSSEEKLSIEVLKPFLVNSIKLVCFNSCQSIRLIQSLKNELLCIGTLKDIEDKEAWLFSKLFFQNLAATKSIQKAFNTASTSSYVLLGSALKYMTTDDELLTREIHELTKALYALQTEMALLKQRLTTLENFLENQQTTVQAKYMVSLIIVMGIIAGTLLYQTFF